MESSMDESPAGTKISELTIRTQQLEATQQIEDTTLADRLPWGHAHGE